MATVVTDITPHPVLLLQGMPRKWLELASVSAAQCKKVRDEFDKSVSKEFKRCVLDLCVPKLNKILTPEEIREIEEKYDIHHKRPISFGGTNDPENLILIAPYAHKAIHRRTEHAISEFEALKRIYEKCLMQKDQKRGRRKTDKDQILRKMHKIADIYVSHQATGVRGFVHFPCPDGVLYVPRLAREGIALPA